MDTEDFLRTLGLPLSATLPAVDRANSRAREALLADSTLADSPEEVRDDVRRLDDGFSAFRDQWFSQQRLARYRAARVRVRVDDKTLLVVHGEDVAAGGTFPFLAEPVHVLTAVNPEGRMLDTEANTQRHFGLVGALEALDLQWWPVAIGVAVAGLSDDDARSLGARWGQEAVFSWTSTDWVVLLCGSAASERSGWTTEVLPEPVPDPVAAKSRRLALKRQDARRVAEEKAAHERDVAAGWPKTWRPADVRKFLQAGGDVLLAQAYDDAGWNFADVSQAIDGHRGDLSQVHSGPPAGSAALHRLHHDSLSELLAGDWPPVPDGAVLSLKRTWRSGRRERSVLSIRHETHVLCRFQHRRGREWKRAEQRLDAPDLDAALKKITGLLSLGKGVISEYTVDHEVIDPTSMLDLVRVSSTGGAETTDGWPREITDDWEAIDDWLTDTMPDVEWVHRWASLNDYRLTGARVVDEHRPLLRPVLIDKREEQLVPLGVIAESTFHSEGGGGPIDWWGGNRLSWVARDLGYAQQWGDPGEAHSLIKLPSEPRALGIAVAEWVLSIDIDADVNAALSLEPFDPRGTLSEAQRARWEERLEAATLSLETNLPPEAEKSLRRQLVRTSELYRRTRNALTRPHSRDGRALAATLDTLEKDGVLGSLVCGNWEYG